jgi:adenosylmethionine-8-amino-7-oxononanoate aminotransferase
VVQVGHGRTGDRRGGCRQAEELAYFPLWSYAHPKAIELAARLADLAPGDLNRVFFTTSGSEAVESAWKLAKQYFKLIGQPERYKVISRELAYHGTSMGALAITGLADIKYPFEPLPPGGVRVPNTNFYRAPGVRPRRPRRRSASGPRTRSSGRSCARDRSRSPPSTWSRCRTPAAASRRLPVTSSGSGRSATGTACCSSPTR